MNKIPKKLIRNKMSSKLPLKELETINDINELNKLYELKISEELAEVKDSQYQNIMEFVDLIQVAIDFAKINGFGFEEIYGKLLAKNKEKGSFTNIALTNLNPNNPSNKIYFNN